MRRRQSPVAPGRAPRPPRLDERADHGYDVVDVITDADGTTHARMVRTYGGLPVIGGDRVVHRGPAGAARGVSQTLEAPLSLVSDDRAAASKRGRRPLAGPSAPPSPPRLVVDATSGTGRARLGGRHRRHPGRRHAEPARDVRRRPHRQGAAARAADPDRRRLRAVALLRHRAAAADAVGLDVPAQGPDPRQHLHDRPEQQGGLAPLPDLRRGCKAGTLFTSPDTSFGNGSTSSRESAAVDAQYGTNVDLGLLQERPTGGTASSATAPAPTTGSTTARTTSTPSGTAPR